MIGRRSFLIGAGGSFAAVVAHAQSPPAIRRIGVLRPGARPAELDIQITGIGTALGHYGYEEGRNIQVLYRFAEGKPEQLPALARELIALRVDVIVAVGVAAILAVREATTTIPIALLANADPLLLGLVPSLARPGSNITGVLIAPGGTLAAKRLWLLREVIPRSRKIALLAPANEPAFQLQINETQAAAAMSNTDLTVVTVQGGAYERAFAEILASESDGLIVGAHQFFVSDRKTIIALAAKHQLPAIYEWPEHVKDGGLLSYGASLTERYRALAGYIDRLLKGARPSDLPLDQPSAFVTAINLSTAKSLGLDLPLSFIARADEVIE